MQTANRVLGDIFGILSGITLLVLGMFFPGYHEVTLTGAFCLLVGGGHLTLAIHTKRRLHRRGYDWAKLSDAYSSWRYWLLRSIPSHQDIAVLPDYREGDIVSVVAIHRELGKATGHSNRRRLKTERKRHGKDVTEIKR